MSSVHSYKSYLMAQQAAEEFLIAYAATGDANAAHRHRYGVDKVRELARHLGFELVPVASNERAAA